MLHDYSKSNFNFRIIPEAYETMIRVLRFPSVTGPEINGQLCRITGFHDLQLSLKSECHEEYLNDEMLRVRLVSDDSREFVVLKSLMLPVEQAITV